MDIKIDLDDEIASTITVSRLKEDLQAYRETTDDPHTIRLMTELAFEVILEYYGYA